MDKKAGFEASAFDDFRAAARAALAYLHDRLGLELWMVFRLDGDDLLIDEVAGPGADLASTELVALARALSSPEVGRVVPVADDVPELAGVPGGRPIGACVIVPLIAAGDRRRRTTAFLCGVDRVPAPELAEQRPLVELVAAMLGGVLNAERRALASSARAERAEEEARTDALTGVASRRSWTRIMEREEARSRRYGHSASIVSIDLDDLKEVNDTVGHAAGDELLRRAADGIKSATRENDVVARLGGDEFGVLAFESDVQAAGALTQRIVAALKRKGIEASVGVATRHRQGTLDETWRLADEAMYEEKRARAQAA